MNNNYSRIISIIACFLFLSTGLVQAVEQKIPQTDEEWRQYNERLLGIKRTVYPWQTDEKLQKERGIAAQKLADAGAIAQEDIVKMVRNKIPVKWIDFKFDLEDMDAPKYPDAATDALFQETLGYFQELKAVALLMTRNLTDEGLISLQRLTNLEKVSISNPFPDTFQMKITEKGLINVSKCPELKEYSIQGISTSPLTMEDICSNATRLQQLNWNTYSLSEEYFEGFACSESLRYLNITCMGDPVTLSPSIFESLSEMKALRSFCWKNINISEAPDFNIIKSLRLIQRRKQIEYVLFIQNDQVHPVIIKELCELRSLKAIRFSGFEYSPSPDQPSCYERVMHEMRKKNAVPEYYQALEKEFEEQLKYRWWSDRKGRDMRAKMTDRTDTKITLVRQDDQKQFVLPIKSLSDDDQLYLKELDRLEAEIQAEK